MLQSALQKLALCLWQASNQFDVCSSIAGDANVQVFKGVNGIDRRLIHCEDYIKLTSEHYHVCIQ